MNDLTFNEIFQGLSSAQKTLSPKFLYDDVGSELFEKICELEVYYPTRAEKEILERYGNEMADLIGSHAQIIEPGSGNAQKVRILLRKLENPLSYHPIEISEDILIRSGQELHKEFPLLKIDLCCADFSSMNFLDNFRESIKGRKIIFFPGSTLGNFVPGEAVQFLKKCKELIRSDGGILIGVDLKKDRQCLEIAYDDPEGVTAEFNLNILHHLNKLFSLDFDPEKFIHRAFYNEALGRIEMHLVSQEAHKIRLGERWIKFNEQETIHTESSYKYSVDDFQALASEAGLCVKRWWTDSKRLFCVYYLVEQRG